MKILIFFLAGIFAAAPLRAEYPAKKEVKMPRDENGVMIHQDQRLDVPGDRKVLQVANNVIQPEDMEGYITRRLEGMEKKIGVLEDTVKTLEGRVADLEKK